MGGIDVVNLFIFFGIGGWEGKRVGVYVLVGEEGHEDDEEETDLFKNLHENFIDISNKSD